MSKSPNIFIPALGGTALAVGLAYGVASRDYGADKIELLETRLGQVEANAMTATEKAKAEAARAAELEARVAEMHAAAAERSAIAVNLTAPEIDGSLAIGRPALPEEIAAWDVDVLPDGRGLPAGSGNAFDGEEIFVDKCAACHGDFAEGVDNWPVLAGGFDTLGDKDPVKTVGSYWPHLSTVWDYVNRSMPFGEAGTLTPDETYAIVAYILYSNDLIDDEFELTRDNLGTFEMPNGGGFVIDDRPAQEYAKWRTEPCMENCKEEVAVTMRSVFLVETPEEGGSESTMNHASVEELPTFSAAGPSFIPVAAEKPREDAPAETPTEETEAAAATEPTDGNAELVAAGEKVFKKCKACHQIGEGAKNRSGPQLNALMGRTMGAVDGFEYSAAFQDALDAGRIWDEASLAGFLAKPKAYMKGTKMSFSGLRKDGDVEAVTEYLKTFGE
ncbi:c-type cytochrome [uncultured Tateyamaria sp.]|uniref:c-type cytochrome n=1 Tax=uncultured Tateyamaria sp. TaxID=455651 RepID=UPI00260C9A93|nr:c-type cytochrome [uncultured Tateyamaria sp.]